MAARSGQRGYWVTWAVLLGLTALTFGLAHVDLGHFNEVAAFAIALTKGQKPSEQTTEVETAGGAKIASILLKPVAVTTDNIESTVVKDNFYGPDSASKICTADYKADCDKYGIK